MPSARDSAPPPVVRWTGWLMAAWCVAFAAVNVAFEGTGRFDQGELAAYSSALSVMNWLVVGLKLLGAVVAVLSVTRRPPPLNPRLLGVLVWGAFATIAAYVLGSVAQLVGMLAGVTGGGAALGVADVAYLAFFLVAAIGWGVLAVSYSRRHGLGWGTAALGALGAPVVLGLLLVVMPALLTAVGVMPAS